MAGKPSFDPILPVARAYRSLATPAFEAVEDVKHYFGHGWDGISRVLFAHSGMLQDFIQTCSYLDIIDGFQIRALWDLYKGGGAFDKQVARFHNGLLSAARGWYEDEAVSIYDTVARQKLAWRLEDKVHWVDLQCTCFIIGCTNKRRLEVYLEWNGIQGYSETLWAISRGDV